MNKVQPAVLLCSVLGVGYAVAQMQIGAPPPTNTNRPPFAADRDVAPPFEPPGGHEHLEQRRQSERQRKIITDTDRLLVLAAQLKADLDKTSPLASQALEEMKKADEIERLARSVKDRMRG